jgi:hypothetical protein
MKKNKKKTNKDRDEGITWCMSQIYTISLALKALQSQVNELSDSHKEDSA